MQRPRGISILATLLIVIGVLGVLGGLSYLSLARMAASQNIAGAQPNALGWVNIGVGLVALIVGWGLWTMKNWAWVTAIAVTVVALLLDIFALFSPTMMMVTGALGIVVCALVIWYLFRPEVRSVFGRARVKAKA